MKQDDIKPYFRQSCKFIQELGDCFHDAITYL